MIHILVGQLAADNLKAAIELDENLQGDIVVLQDTLGIGPLSSEEELSFDALRTQFWSQLQAEPVIECKDEETIKQTLERALAEEEPLCFWLGPCVTDVMAYYWLLPYFKPHPGVLHTINIIGLPFLNEKGQLFYPQSFSQIPAKEFTKTKRLLKEVSPAEYETEGDEWGRLIAEQTWVRIYEGGKKIISKDVHHYDALIKSSLTAEFQKGSKVLNEAQKKCTQTLSHLFLEWRLRQMIAQEQMTVNGDTSKTLREFEVKKVAEPAASSEAEVVDQV
ncbi:MAG: DUF1835 domain-containing protein [Chitinophagaceae bacterium]|nr:DUF1835 domain-containing protein [Chitinophagaceae bacterium]